MTLVHAIKYSIRCMFFGVFFRTKLELLVILKRLCVCVYACVRYNTISSDSAVQCLVFVPVYLPT